jgi:hypothetical protein
MVGAPFRTTQRRPRGVVSSGISPVQAQLRRRGRVLSVIDALDAAIEIVEDEIDSRPGCAVDDDDMDERGQPLQ